MKAVIDTIAELVSFDTVSSNSNLPLIEAVDHRLKGVGAKTRRVYDVTGTKANLYARIGPQTAGGIVLSGHTDVVPVDGQIWDSNPFDLIERNGKLFGRGTTDMKGFIGCAIALAPRMVVAKLKRPIYIALSYDEEIGCLGAPSMIKDMWDTQPEIDAVIVGEPTEMRIATSHKGSQAGTVTFKGLEAHSSKPNLGVSANHFAIRMMADLDRISEELSREECKVEDMSPPFSTLNIGVIRGGTASNIVSESCQFTWDYRYVPNSDPSFVAERIAERAQSLETEMRALYQGAEVAMDVTSIPGLLSEDFGKAAAIVRKLTGQNCQISVPFGTEAGQFQQQGYSAVVCGPGSIEQAHKPNEFISLEQVLACVEFIEKIIAHQSA